RPSFCGAAAHNTRSWRSALVSAVFAVHPCTRRQVLQLVVRKTPLIALSAVSSIVTLLAQRGAIGRPEHLPVSARISNALFTYVYIRQIFLPAALVVFYPRPRSKVLRARLSTRASVASIRFLSK